MSINGEGQGIAAIQTFRPDLNGLVLNDVSTVDVGQCLKCQTVAFLFLIDPGLGSFKALRQIFDFLGQRQRYVCADNLGFYDVSPVNINHL